MISATSLKRARKALTICRISPSNSNAEYQRGNVRMNRCRGISTSRVSFILLAALCCPSLARPQSTAARTDSAPTDVNRPAAMLHALDQVVEQNRQLEKQNRELMDQIESLRQVLAKQASSTGATGTETAPNTEAPATAERSQPSEKQRTPADTSAAAEEPSKWGAY